MNKRLLPVLALTLVLGFSGCKNTPADDIYNDDTTSVVTTDETTVVPDGSSDTDDKDQVAETDETTEAPDESHSSESTEEAEDNDETVTDDLYDSSQESEIVDITDLEVEYVQSASVDDPELKSKMSDFLTLFYKNIFFGDGDYAEAGIAEEDKIRFAVSHIGQNEWQGLKFDTKTFKVYVPEERVEELVEHYFGVSLSGHYSFTVDEVEIEYNGGYYLYPTSDKNWQEEVRIETIESAGDFAYTVVFSTYDIENQHMQSYEVMLEIRNDRFILTGYKFTELPSEELSEGEGADEESDETTSDDSAGDGE